VRIGDSFEDWIESNLEVLSRGDGESGPQIKCVCPWCGRKKFFINAETGLWICYRESCESREVSRGGKGGHAGHLVAEVEGISLQRAKALAAGFGDFASATVEELADRVAPPPEPPPPADERSLPPGFMRITPRAYPLYLQERGIPATVARRYRLGTAPGRRWGGRVIVPAYQNGSLEFFQGRAVNGQEPKYDSPSWSRAHVLLGWDQIREKATRVCLVEGPFDVLGLARWGIPALAVLGVDLHNTQLSMLGDRFRHVTIMLDPEAKDAIKRFRRQLVDVVPRVDTALLPPGQDPGSATKKQVARAIANAR